MSKPAKIGPWGGNGGTAQDVNINQKTIRVVSVTINSGEDVMNAISFEYVGSDYRMYSVGPWDGIGVKEEKTTIQLLNFVKEISGTVGKFLNTNVVTSLTIVFQTESPKTYGKASGTPFRIPLLDVGRIVGFFGRSGAYLNAIGLYIKPSALNGWLMHSSRPGSFSATSPLEEGVRNARVVVLAAPAC